LKHKSDFVFSGISVSQVWHPRAYVWCVDTATSTCCHIALHMKCLTWRTHKRQGLWPHL